MTLAQIVGVLNLLLFSALGIGSAGLLDLQEAILAATSLTALGAIIGVLCFVALSAFAEEKQEMQRAARRAH